MYNAIAKIQEKGVIWSWGEGRCESKERRGYEMTIQYVVRVENWLC